MSIRSHLKMDKITNPNKLCHINGFLAKPYTKIYTCISPAISSHLQLQDTQIFNNLNLFQPQDESTIKNVPLEGCYEYGLRSHVYKKPTAIQLQKFFFPLLDKSVIFKLQIFQYQKLFFICDIFIFLRIKISVIWLYTSSQQYNLIFQREFCKMRNPFGPFYQCNQLFVSSLTDICHSIFLQQKSRCDIYIQCKYYVKETCLYQTQLGHCTGGCLNRL